MKYSTKVSDALHCLAFIYLNPRDDLSSAAIAYSIHTNPSYMRQIMAALKKAGLIDSQQGKANPVLKKDTQAITMFDVYRAMEGDKPLLHLDTQTNPACGLGVNIPLVIRDCYNQVQMAAEAEMKKITLADIIDGYYRRTGGRVNGNSQ